MKLDDIERRLGEWVQQGMRKMADEILPRLQVRRYLPEHHR